MSQLAEQVAERLVIKAYASGAIDAETEPTPSAAPEATGGKILRYVSQNFSLTKESYTSPENRTDRQTPLEKHGTRRAPGTINGILSPETYEELFEAVLQGTWADPNIDLASSDLTSVAASASGSNFVFGGGNPVSLGLRVGHVIRFSSLSETDNNARNFVILGFSSANNRTVAVYPAPEDMSADTSFAVATVGSVLKVPTSDHVSRKFAVEVYNSDADLARLFTEIRFAGFELQAAPNQNVTVNFSGLGRNRYVYDSSDAPFFSAPSAGTTTDVISSMDGLLRLRGETVGVVTGVSLSFNRPPSAPAALNSAGRAAGVLLQNAVAGGDFTIFLKDKTLMDAYADEEELELLLYLPNSDAIDSAAMVFYMPRIKISSNDETTIEGAKAFQCRFSAGRYFGTDPGVESTALMIVDTEVTS